MNILEGIILGAVQGLTEFLPVSSSGHLIIARDLLGINSSEGLAVDAVLQLATAAAVFIYFWRDFLRIAEALMRNIGDTAVPNPEDKTLLWAIVIGTIPAVAGGLLLENTMETVFRSAELVAWSLIVGSLFFVAAEKLATQDKKLSVKRGLVIGFCQILALVPGFSRSGATISGGLLAGLTREEAARFSFLLSFPIILGSGLKKAIELSGDAAFHEVIPLVFSCAAAFVVGIATIHFLMRFLKTHTLYVFVWYRLMLAALVLAFVYIS